jgi:hypothetical protein
VSLSNEQKQRNYDDNIVLDNPSNSSGFLVMDGFDAPIKNKKEVWCRVVKIPPKVVMVA